jgi:hypothetical protein
MAIVFSRGKAITQPLSIPVAEPTDDLRIIYSTTLVHGILTGNIGYFGFFEARNTQRRNNSRNTTTPENTQTRYNRERFTQRDTRQDPP